MQVRRESLFHDNLYVAYVVGVTNLYTRRVLLRYDVLTLYLKRVTVSGR